MMLISPIPILVDQITMTSPLSAGNPLSKLAREDRCGAEQAPLARRQCCSGGAQCGDVTDQRVEKYVQAGPGWGRM
jgi:hypothetical protein